MTGNRQAAVRRMADAEFGVARKRMVERDLLAAGIVEKNIVAAFLKVPRDRFVHQEAMRLQAYDSAPLPIGLGQTLSAASTQAKMTQALDLQSSHRVLEIGTGSGYQTAILAELAAKVFTIERHQELHRRAIQLLRELGYHTILAKAGDGSMGWEERAPFDRIILTACSPNKMPALMDQLAPGGILVAPAGDLRGEQRLIRIRKSLAGSFHQEDMGPCQFVPLIGDGGFQQKKPIPPPRLKFAHPRC